MFIGFKRKLVNALTRKHTNVSNADKSRKELVTALNDIKLYLSRAKNSNDHKRSMFKTMTWRQQSIVNAAGYSKKLNKADTLLNENYNLLKDMYVESVKRYNVTSLELKEATDTAKLSRYNDHYRVVESLCHYSRDWSSLGDPEIGPLIKYIKSNLSNVNFADTVAVVPGSGLGRVAHELSAMNFKGVHAIEFSPLMVLFNEFVYANQKEDPLLCNSPKQYKIHPFIHNYSNHVSSENQFRSINFEQLRYKPDNLSIHQCDFNLFNISKFYGPPTSTTNSAAKNTAEPPVPKDQLPNNIVIVTCFFMDTAENLLDYFDSVNRIADNFKGKKTWINVGPLKYGTAAKVELNYDELKMVREKMGWKTVDELENPEILGYLTDTESLWRGYYGVTMWTSERE